jgi:hypothetical protein
MQLNDFFAVKATEQQLDVINRLTEMIQIVAEGAIAEIPASAHRTAGLRILLEAKMTLIHAITHPTQQ